MKLSYVMDRGATWTAAALLTALAPLAFLAPASAASLHWVVDQSPSSPPNSLDLSGVSCPSSASCTAVGVVLPPAASQNPIRPLIESWNGAAWSLPSAPAVNNAELNAVSCPAANACIAVGNTEPTSKTFAETWNGSTWTV
ncbi:MAG TPA: hypothetical protein VGS19_38360, partial [Streptosporangiaceae bacterium]|nr:hypothetical protein [Streptosporangiaceae bacterium]